MNSISSINSYSLIKQTNTLSVTIQNFTWALNSVNGQRVTYTSDPPTFIWLSPTFVNFGIAATFVINNTPLSGTGQTNSPSNWNNVPVRTACYVRNQTRDFYQDVSINEVGTYQVSYWISANQHILVPII